MIRNTMLKEDQLLAAKIAKGDKQAFRIMYELTYGKVARYVKGFVSNEEMAEDVVIQTYTIAWQKASDFRGSSRLTTWLIGIARNTALKEFRKTRNHVPFDEAYISADHENFREPERQDRKKKMKQALTVLSLKHREILELVFYQDLTYPEISKLINIPVNTVKTRVFHAKRALQDEMSNRGITSDDI